MFGVDSTWEDHILSHQCYYWCHSSGYTSFFTYSSTSVTRQRLLIFRRPWAPSSSPRLYWDVALGACGNHHNAAGFSHLLLASWGSWIQIFQVLIHTIISLSSSFSLFLLFFSHPHHVCPIQKQRMEFSEQQIPLLLLSRLEHGEREFFQPSFCKQIPEHIIADSSLITCFLVSFCPVLIDLLRMRRPFSVN